MINLKFHNLIITIVCCISSTIGTYAQIVSDTIIDQNIPEITIIESYKSDNAFSVSSTQGIDHDRMEQTNVIQVSDALKYFNGVAVKDYGGLGGLKTISVRGLGANHTAVAYDGIIQTDIQTGQIDLGRMSSTQVGSIRLVNGIDNDILQPAVLSASATTLNIEGKRPNIRKGNSHELSTDLKIGSFNTMSASVSMIGQISRRIVSSVSAEMLTSNGDYPYIQDNGNYTQTLRRENSDIKKLKTEFSLIADLSETRSLSIKGYLYKAEHGLPSNILYNKVAALERMWNSDAFIQASYRSSWSEHWRTLANIKYSNSHSRYQNRAVNNASGITDNRYTQQEAYASYAVLYRISQCLSASLAEDIRISTLTGNSVDQVSPRRESINSALSVKYANNKLVFTSQLNHIYSHESTKMRQAANDCRDISPAIGFNAKLSEDGGLHWRTSAKGTYRLPTFNDLYFEQVGRRDLKPEKAELYSTGLIWDTGYSSSWENNSHISISADFFINKISNKIVAVPGRSTAIWMMRNIGTVISRGFETGIEISTVWGHGKAGITSSYTYNRAMDKTDIDGITYNHQISYTPRASGSCILYISTENTGFSYNMFFSGEYFSNSYNGPEYRMPSYSEHGCSIWKNFKTGDCDIKVKGEAINLFNNRYEVVRNYPMPGAQYRIGLNITM